MTVSCCNQLQFVIAEIPQANSEAYLADDIVEKIGEQSSSAQLHAGDRHLKRDERVDDHDAALRAAFDMLGEAGIDLRSCG